MNISSTPFIRNDYWPDYNDINKLNKRIDETENEISLVNIRLSADIENVSNSLNSYINNQANTTIANNIIVNSLNANYAEGKFANFTNTNTDNAYIENLTVNKPVFDITLNTPHIENATSLGGNFYNTNLIDPKFSGDASGDFNTVNVDIINANTANIGNLFVNTQPEPITSSAVLGYDSEGRVIPVHATYDASFPENANYLFTDSHGTAFAGTAATEVGETNNLITSFAVKNALDDYANTVNESFNLVNNALGDIDSWQNNLENNIANSFNDVANNFNDVANNFNDVANSFNDVANNFNDVANSFNDVANNFNDVANNFNDVANKLNEANNTINSLQDKIRILSVDGANNYWSGAPVNYQNVTRIKFLLDGRAGTQVSGKPYPVNIVFNSTSNTLEFYSSNFVGSQEDPDAGYPKSLSQIFNRDISYLFRNCTKLNFSGNMLQYGYFDFNFCESTGSFITNMQATFQDCSNFNQKVIIPNSVIDMANIFQYCYNFNQNILIPNSVIYLNNAFQACRNLNLPDMYIYSQNITNMTGAFYYAGHIGNIHIPASVPKSTSNFMYNCLVNGNTGITFSAANIINDLPVDIEQWPPV